jgi:hypothetical protein
VSCQSIAQACDLRGATAQRCWHQIAEVLTERGNASNILCFFELCQGALRDLLSLGSENGEVIYSLRVMGESG